MLLQDRPVRASEILNPVLPSFLTQSWKDKQLEGVLCTWEKLHLLFEHGMGIFDACFSDAVILFAAHLPLQMHLAAQLVIIFTLHSLFALLFFSDLSLQCSLHASLIVTRVIRILFLVWSNEGYFCKILNILRNKSVKRHCKCMK